MQPLGAEGAWETLGAGRYRGVVAENIEASANEWGPDVLTFNVKAGEHVAQRPDLLPFTPVELELDGLVCWAGRVVDRQPGDTGYAVRCQGWQYHLDDDVIDKVYVHRRLNAWTDWRSHIDSDLAAFISAPQVSADAALKIALPNGVAVPATTRVGVLLDTHATGGAKRVVVKLTNNTWGSGSLYMAASDTTAGFNFASPDWTVAALTTPRSSSYFSVTLGTARRYLLIYAETGAHTPTVDEYASLEDVQVYADTAYESGNASVLTADTIIKDARATATLLTQSNDLISASSFVIPEYATDRLQTPRQVMEAANAFEDYQLKVGGGDLRTIVYRTKPTVPLFEVGEWAGADFADASVTGQDIYSKAIVDGTGPDNTPVTVTRTQTGTLVDRRSFARTKVLPIRSAITTAVANQFGDLFLATHRTAPFAGRLTVRGNALRRHVGGGTIAAHELLAHTGELIHFGHRIDSDTGALGRDGRIAAVTYNHDRRTAVVDIDDRRGHFETLLGRYGLLVDQLR